MKNYKIAVAGTGYVGLSLGVLLSQHHQVVAVDIVQAKVDMINNKKSPIQDDYIEKYLAEKDLDLTATLDAKAAYSDADFVVIAAPTNYDSHTQHFDTSAVEAVIKLVMEYNPNAIMVIKSTIPVGYTASVREKFNSKNIIFSPEFLRESKALYDNLYLRDPAIVIRKDSITFNTACITGLEDVVYVHVMFNNDLKRIVVRGCDENDKDALRWCVAKPDKRKSRKMSCKPFATLVYQKMGWDSECRYKMLGYRITFECETLYVFDLLVPEIFHEGQRKKNAVDSQDNAAATKPVNSRKGFYPDDIVGTFGVPVEEHRKESEVKQMDGYVSMGILTGKIVPEAGKD